MHSFVVLYDKKSDCIKSKVDNILLWEYILNKNGDDIYEKKTVSRFAKHN